MRTIAQKTLHVYQARLLAKEERRRFASASGSHGAQSPACRLPECGGYSQLHQQIWLDKAVDSSLVPSRTYGCLLIAKPLREQALLRADREFILTVVFLHRTIFFELMPSEETAKLAAGSDSEIQECCPNPFPNRQMTITLDLPEIRTRLASPAST